MSLWKLEEDAKVRDEDKRTICAASTVARAEQIIREHNTFPELVSFLVDSKHISKNNLMARRKLLLAKLRLEG